MVSSNFKTSENLPGGLVEHEPENTKASIIVTKIWNLGMGKKWEQLSENSHCSKVLAPVAPNATDISGIDSL